jgi:hypothetical protein
VGDCPVLKKSDQIVDDMMIKLSYSGQIRTAIFPPEKLRGPGVT